MAHHPEQRAPLGLLLVAVVVVVLGLLGSGVALAYAGWSPESITGLLLGLGTVAGTILPLVAKVLTETRQQTKTLDEVKESTNGRMHQTIDTAVQAAIEKHFPDDEIKAA